MGKIDRQLKNGQRPSLKNRGKRFLQEYKNGKIYLTDLEIKKGGHTQKFR